MDAILRVKMGCKCNKVNKINTFRVKFQIMSVHHGAPSNHNNLT